MNLLVGHSTAVFLFPSAPLLLTTAPFRQFTAQTAGGPRPCHFGAYSSSQGGKLKLDGGLLLSESNPHAFLAGCARHTCRLLVLWLLQAGTHGIVDGCCRVERPCRAIAVDGDVVPVVG